MATNGNQDEPPPSSAVPADAEAKVEVKEPNGQHEEVDFSKVSLDEALKILQTSNHGLSPEEAAKRLDEYGPNKLPETTRNPILVFLSYMWNPLAWAMEVAAIISIALLDYADFALIVALLLVNATISYVEESNADKAIKSLAAALAPKSKVLRGGEVKTLDAVELVPGDVIIIRLGDIVPADVKILPEEGHQDASQEVPMQIDQAALTGESLPAKKFTGDVAFSGSAVKQGERHAVVYATGVNTFFGRAAALIQGTQNVANLQKVMNKIGAICLITIGIWVVIELAVQFGHYKHACGGGEGGCPTLTNMLVIIVGGIPIAMPTVLSVTLALGAFKLAKEGAIVARMSAVEEMAGLDILCSDKTGTLTLNKLSIETQNVMPLSGHSVEDVLKYGALSANIVTEEPIDMVLFQSYPDAANLKAQYAVKRFVPFNPVDKYTIAVLQHKQTGEIISLLKGSPQVVLAKAYNKDQIGQQVHDKITEFANRGFRSLGVAKADGDGPVDQAKWDMLGLLPMFDPPRHDTKETIERCHAQGIEVKMITGDHLLIGKETAKMLGMGTLMFPSETLIKAKNGDAAALSGFKTLEDMVLKCNGFAEVFPEHKFQIVEILQEADHVVGMTGDGVNDAPALKKADVGIAVAGATDGARGAADIVLTEPGLSTIVTAVIGARKIFQRMTTYARYTVSVTFRICFTLGLITVIYNWYFPTILIVILAVFNDGAMIALAKDRVVPSTLPNSWDIRSIFITGLVYGLYLTLSSWALFHTATKTTFFEDKCGLFSLNDKEERLDGFCRDHIAAYYPGVAPEASLCSIPSYAEQLGTPCNTDISVLTQCKTEQYYVRGAMMRALLYTQISISGQALVFVVRHKGYSLFQRAGLATYLAFLLAQGGATIIGIFGFNGYQNPNEDHFEDCQFCGLSTGGPTRFFSKKEVPRAGTESVYTASVIGCTGYVIVAWIWSALWYLLLDPLKWAMLWILNEDGFRDQHKWRTQKKRTMDRTSNKADYQYQSHGGMVVATHQNPLGRASLSKPVSHMLDRQSAAVVMIKRDSATGVARVSNDPQHAMTLARRSSMSMSGAEGAGGVQRQSPVARIIRNSMQRQQRQDLEFASRTKELAVGNSPTNGAGKPPPA